MMIRMRTSITTSATTITTISAINKPSPSPIIIINNAIIISVRSQITLQIVTGYQMNKEE